MKNHRPFRIVFTLLITCATLSSFGQEEQELKIIDDLKDQLESNANVNEVNKVHSIYDNGMTKELCIGVKYKGDTTDRWLLAGPYFMYHENGRLWVKAAADKNTGILCDTRYVYDMNGAITSKNFFPDTCSNFKYALMAFDNKSGDTIFAHFPMAFQKEIYKYKRGKISAVKSKRIVWEPFYSRELHGSNLKYNHKKGVVTETIYEIGEIVSEKTNRLD